MSRVAEYDRIELLAEFLPRSPDQLNGLQESDSELIRIPGTDTVLAVTTDSIVEEIEMGLYRDPYLIGWMTVMVSASDLAAVGASPVGVLVSETLPRDASRDFLVRLQEGIRDASVRSALPVLGGDTNTSSRLLVASSAIGVIEDGVPLMRMGARPGDVVMSTGQLGMGSCHAWWRLFSVSGRDNGHFRPVARLKEGLLLRGRASACIDTSDGAFAALDLLVRLNNVGFVVEVHRNQFMHPAAVRLAATIGLPAWSMMAGLHGEFELLFTIGEGDAARAAQSMGCRRVGRVVETPGVWIDTGSRLREIDTGRVRNCFERLDGEVDSWLAKFKGVLNIPAGGS
jgi:thiamine-monophosphate kinase